MLLNCQPAVCLVLAQAKCHSRRSLLGKTRSWQSPAAIPGGQFACGHPVLEGKRFTIGMWPVPWLLTFVQENDFRHIQCISRYTANLTYSFQDMLAVCFWAQHFKGICDKAPSTHPVKTESFYFVPFWHFRNFRQPQQPMFCEKRHLTATASLLRSV